MKVKELVRAVGKAASDNLPTLLSLAAIGGVITTAILSHEAALNADMALAAKCNYDPDEEDKLTPKEKAEVMWKYYIPPVVAGGCTIALIVGANRVSIKRTAAMAALYSLTDEKLKKYQQKILEKIGEKDEKEIRESIIHDDLSENPETPDHMIYTGKGDTLCYDCLSGRYFKSSMESIRKAVNDINYQMLGDFYVSLNELYYALGLPGIKLGDNLGWNMDSPMDVQFHSMLTDFGEPCLTVDYDVNPRYKYGDLAG